MEQKIRPMLALTTPVKPADVDLTRGPVWVSPKLDGIRALAMDSGMMSRAMKPLPNEYLQELLGSTGLIGLDGEIVVGSPTAPNCINATTSGVMSHQGYPDLSYHVFDMWNMPNVGFLRRYRCLKRKVQMLQRCGFPIVLVPQILCQTLEEIETAVADNYDAGYEGSIVRSYDDLYKYGRSTMREALLLKVKESIDFEIHIIGFEEMYHNENEAKLDERGYTKRSTHKAGKVPAGTLGKLIGISVETGETVTAGRGKMTAEEALYVWTHKEEYFGSFAKVRSGKHGVKDKPRFPRFVAWRDASDM